MLLLSNLSKYIIENAARPLDSFLCVLNIFHVQLMYMLLSFLFFLFPFLYVIDQKRVQVFNQGVPNTEKKMKARHRRRSAFIVSRCLEPLMKNEAGIFELASQMQQ